MKRKQCRACPWRVDVKPSRDVPKYGEGIYDRMRSTLRSGLETLNGKPYIAMACHNQKDGAQLPCAGWLHNQLGVGNNIGVRLRVMAGTLPAPVVFGAQHETVPASDE